MMSVRRKIMVASVMPAVVVTRNVHAVDTDPSVYSHSDASSESASDTTATRGVENSKIELVMSKVSCNRSMALNALLSHGNDVDLALLFLGSSSRNVEKDDGVQTFVDQTVSSPDDTKQFGIQNSALSVCSSSLDSGETYPTTTGISSYIPFDVTSQPDDSSGSSSVSLKDSVMNELFLACRSGEAGVVRRLLERGGIDVNKRNMGTGIAKKQRQGETATGPLENMTPLGVACNHGHVEVVKAFLDFQDTKVDQESNYGYTPLHAAAEKGQVEVVTVLLHASNAQVDAKSAFGETPLHLASKAGHIRIVELLISGLIKKHLLGFAREIVAQNTYGMSARRYAELHGHRDVAKLLTVWGDSLLPEEGRNYDTPLHVAAEQGNVAVVKRLIQDGNLPVDPVGTHCNTPLHLAANSGHIGVVLLLISALKDQTHPHRYVQRLSALNSSGYTPQDLAVSNGHIDVLKLFPISAIRYSQIISDISNPT